MINQVILVGNTGKEPEIRTFQDGTSVASFSVATNKKWADKTTGEQKEITQWHRVVCYRNTADYVRDHLAKGARVFIQGELIYRKYKDNEGQEKQITEIQASQVRIFDYLKNTSSQLASEKVHQRIAQQVQVESPENLDDIPF